MSQPERPDYQAQGPASNCVLQGRHLGWLSCTNYAFAMAMQKASLGKVALSGCAVRDETGDTTGGTTIPQNAAVAKAHGIAVEQRVGGNVASPSYLAYQVQSGRGVVVQGNTAPLLDTKWRSTPGAVNHAIYVNETRGGSVGSPAEGLVYDPAADGRQRPYRVDQGPSWWPWSLVLRFAYALHPWGEDDPRVLGPGKVYCALFVDTEPHTHLRFGAAKTQPFPDRTRVDRKGGQWAYRTPAYGIPNRVRRLYHGELFVSFQVVTKSGRKWAGDHDGTAWIPAGNLSHVGGGT